MVDGVVEELKRISKKHGFKVTPQRIAILKEVLSRRDHPSAEDIYHSLKSKIPGISLTTVYRTLSYLEEFGFIHRVPTLTDKVRYETRPVPHSHFICTNCGSIYDLDDVPQLDIEQLRSKGMEPSGCTIVCYGICRACRERR